LLVGVGVARMSAALGSQELDNSALAPVNADNCPC